MSANGSAAELKVQGVEESARDPNTSTTANDAQRKIINESKKAGVAAFTFDPDATPEEKAAQARAVRIPNGSYIYLPMLIITSAACASRISSRTQI